MEELPQRDWFSRPADSLIAAMQRRNVTADQVAERLSGGLGQLREFVAGTRQIDKAAAAVFADTVGGSATFWLKRQENYERDLAQAVAAVPSGDVEVWLKSIPLPGPKLRGQAGEYARQAELARRLAFFGVSTLGAWQRKYAHNRGETRFRTSSTFGSSDGAVSLWLRQGELEASLVDTASWNPDLLRSRLRDIAKLSRIAKPERFLPRLKQLLSETGVAFVALRAPNECKASGACRLIRPDKAMLLVSFRYRSDDHFWFTVLHEIGHLLLHGAKPFVDEDDMLEDECEKEANQFASNVIVPVEFWARFDELDLHHEEIARFAVSIGVGSGLILGQLQHQGRVPRDRLNFLRRRWTWDAIDSAIANL